MNQRKVTFLMQKKSVEPSKMDFAIIPKNIIEKDKCVELIQKEKG